ncbi:hypothetical protein PTTG_28585 [Puccinia triticina 1-1 BBBD Race 1]|uniref:Uncharacterized protein n=1 Tax=Puccinia triticina (isolate 1-1 / race 1 (BBBD)) TaxID=630390 RepID=A0A180GAK5_PUCT1|nr:hypothetical protein PTTG_28585 [Puccinia triticina 1-1 BBBD Race 1]
MSPGLSATTLPLRRHPLGSLAPPAHLVIQDQISHLHTYDHSDTPHTLVLSLLFTPAPLSSTSSLAPSTPSGPPPRSAVCSPRTHPSSSPPSRPRQPHSILPPTLAPSSRVVALHSLTIEPAKAAWVVYIYLVCLSHNGDLFNAALAALRSARTRWSPSTMTATKSSSPPWTTPRSSPASSTTSSLGISPLSQSPAHLLPSAPLPAKLLLPTLAFIKALNVFCLLYTHLTICKYAARSLLVYTTRAGRMPVCPSPSLLPSPPPSGSLVSSRHSSQSQRIPCP